jgi:dolichol-phosphate mannosyltransferase
MIPCYNEEKGLPKVIKFIPKDKLKALGYKTDILVIDNNSCDKTSKVAKQLGARVVFEKKQGKGHAVKTGIKNLGNTDIVVMLDGDDTYDPREMLRLIEPIDSGFCDVVLGSRLSGKMMGNSMSLFNRIGNWIFTFLVRTFYQGNVTDVCTGYFAWEGNKIKELGKYLESDGFSIEMEMVAKMSKLNFEIFSVPITYNTRKGRTSLRPFGDGKKIVHAWLRNLLWKP